MQDSYIEINSVLTHVYTWGHHVNEELKNEEIDKLILIITGNYTFIILACYDLYLVLLKLYFKIFKT